MQVRLFALGSNGSGQLGIGHQEDVSIPEECFFDPNLKENETIIAIRAGGNHTLALTSRRRVFATGSCAAFPGYSSVLRSFKQLDMESLGLPSASEITNIAASWESSYLVVDKQVVYTCGTGYKGQLGLGDWKTVATKPQATFDLRRHGDGRSTVRDICAGPTHVALLTDNGEVYGWGTSRKGELGEEAKEEGVLWSPWKIDVAFHPNCAVTGRNFTFIRGKDNEKVLLGSTKQLLIDDLLELSKNAKIFCGWSNIYSLESGDLQAMGRNDHGQVPSINLPQLSLFAAGSEHGVGCTGDGQVIAFGWGEHGNCGEPIDGRGNVAGRFNTIAIPKTKDEVVYLVAAGCATTFVAVSSI